MYGTPAPSNPTRTELTDSDPGVNSKQQPPRKDSSCKLRCQLYPLYHWQLPTVPTTKEGQKKTGVPTTGFLGSYVTLTRRSIEASMIHRSRCSAWATIVGFFSGVVPTVNVKASCQCLITWRWSCPSRCSTAGFSPLFSPPPPPLLYLPRGALPFYNDEDKHLRMSLSVRGQENG